MYDAILKNANSRLQNRVMEKSKAESNTDESAHFGAETILGRLQALDALGEITQLFGRILPTKILRAFPQDICRNWVVYAKRQSLAESEITKLMKFVAEKIEGEVVASNNKVLIVSEYSVQWSLENFNMHSEQQKNHPFALSAKQPSILLNIATQ
ncbi:integrase catalytic domain-containing protein [Nephila pilipes]|uniref:Integrase catalytic domain-containing protein n=1 Tax=Nephila pilipes TaxID=299642 RepID=A0A8X6K2C3_NEPPI|nr:integrase catalytic domain-containing protein [Nephila pilipes]